MTDDVWEAFRHSPVCLHNPKVELDRIGVLILRELFDGAIEEDDEDVRRIVEILKANFGAIFRGARLELAEAVEQSRARLERESENLQRLESELERLDKIR